MDFRALPTECRPGFARAMRVTICGMSLPSLALFCVPALAQATSPDAPVFWDDSDPGSQADLNENRPEGVPDFEIPAPVDPNAIGFAADELEYDTDADVVTAAGNVLMRRGDQDLRADRVVWDRATGEIVADGNIRLIDSAGNVVYTDRLTLTEELRAGAMENMLLVLAEGGRLAAIDGRRGEDGRIVLGRTSYSPCPVETADGCPKEPSWKITANRVVYDPETQRVKFSDARLVLFGAPVLPLFGIVIRADGQPVSGLGTPNLRFSESNGVEVSADYYWRLSENREITLGTSVYTDVLPMVSAQYRALTEDGAYQITGYATSSSRIPLDGSANPEGKRDFRGYIDANGRFQISPEWSVTASARRVTDRTFLRRYDISRDDRLRSTFSVDRADDDSYLAISGWATQTLRVGEDQGLVPMALPLVDYRHRLNDPVLGGRIMLQANSLMLNRTDGQDTQRAFAGATWNLRHLTGWGQEVVLTGMARGDVYHTDNSALTSVPLYRGSDGWKGRGVAIGAVDVKWPLTGEIFGGTQVLTPRVQLVASPHIRNLAIPNEDARATDLEDSNLFALNRFPGYDRVEDGVRFTYGFDWQWQRPGWRVHTVIGQSYRLGDREPLLPDGTGLTSRTSDIVGRAEVRFRDFVQLTHRFRLDKDNLASRRSEFDIALGSRRTYVEAGYLKLDRNIPASLEDLQDREELRLAGRVAFARYWSVFGSTVINLTNRAEDPSATSDGFDPLRTRLGIAYDDDCMEFAFTWRRDNRSTGDAEKGNAFLLRFSLKT